MQSGNLQNKSCDHAGNSQEPDGPANETQKYFYAESGSVLSLLRAQPLAYRRSRGEETGAEREKGGLKHLFYPFRIAPSIGIKLRG
jgi:hypothetical protein